ncbi:MAG: hypothetical protein IJ833_03465 [Lachnospiraceae bacterium]|nr:hypothetical protein [Lachnospiraceae bacterium]
MKRKIKGLMIVVGLSMVLAGCGNQDAEEEKVQLVQEEEQESFAAATVEYGNVIQRVTIPCTYTSTEEVEHAFPVSDKMIVQVSVKKGDFVSEGALLAALDVKDVEEQIEEQEYLVQSLELKLKQTKELYDFDKASADILYSYTARSEQDKKQLEAKKKSIDRQYKNAIEDLEDQVSIGRKRLKEYRQELKDGQLFASITGEITFLASPLKDTFSRAGNTVAIISNLDSCYFIAETDEYAAYFAEGETVEVTYRVGSESKSVEVVPVHREEWDGRMLFQPLAEELVSTGTEGSIGLVLDEREGVLCIPKSALHQSNQGPFVYIAKEGLLEMQYVTVGLEGEGMVEITKGLSQGDIVALKK